MASEIVAEVAQIPDPEVPVITIADLGILRSAEVVGDELQVVITPTYSGCPAMEAIRDRIAHVARTHHLTAVVTHQLTPEWTTDWMTEEGREALRHFGIAPPGQRPQQSVGLSLTIRQVECPQCGSAATEELSRFSGTSCKALRRCLACREPFEEFKAI
ncbi:1,2-phenylacetyl-CoA epoxidase subunit PaaD [Demetria terragena]|uniref:1,2-phenylacetyl-CoA epoxidase subunit PaaD n=1 Tax=Demetria terragena TaxID=63959 RepID=UPI000374073C|nr:1,2-phenylacetyl-CoA epoxidase subunit PaaD [Demetria terragena]